MRTVARAVSLSSSRRCEFFYPHATGPTSSNSFLVKFLMFSSLLNQLFLEALK